MSPPPNPDPGTGSPALGMSWAELPAATTGNDLVTTWYSASAGRNYSMLYDKSMYTAYWVAYPLTASHTGGSNSTWRQNPDTAIGSAGQINVWNGTYGVSVPGSNGDTYNRGHQVPRADRGGMSAMVQQAYYATNSTPQIQNGFNGGIWQVFEGAVRGEASRTDTLYVVTGAIFRTVGGSEPIGYIRPATDSRQCPVPNYYYKVLLKCARDGSGTITGASTIGVWMPHRVYSGDSWTNYVVSVKDIEALTGYDFFANLPSGIAAAAEQNNSWSAFTTF